MTHKNSCPKAVASNVKISETLLQILESKVLPWASQVETARLLVAQKTKDEFVSRNAPLPGGVNCSPAAFKGQSKAIHGKRLYGKRSTDAAVWPEDHLLTSRLPIIICPFEGCVDFRVGDYFIHAGPGHFILLPPDVPRDDGSSPHLLPTRRNSKSTERCSLFWLRPSEQGLECWVCHSQGERHWGSAALEEHLYILHREAYGYFATLAQEAQNGAPYWQNLTRALLLALLSVLHRDIATGRFYGRGQMGQAPAQITPLDNPIAHAQQFMREHMEEPLTIDRVAQKVYLARTQLTTRFRAETGLSFTQYLTQCRLEKAQTLLRDTQLAVRVVAHLVGVEPSHLRRLFRRKFSYPPEEYRRRHTCKLSTK